MRIYFTTVSNLKNQKLKTVVEILKHIYVYYFQRKFQITEFLLDPQFEAMAPLICDKIGAPRINVTAASEHVTPVERRIKVVKERCRAPVTACPFPRITSFMTTSMVLFCGRMLNNFPSKGGVSDRFSPRMLLTGENLDAKRISRWSSVLTAKCMRMKSLATRWLQGPKRP